MCIFFCRDFFFFFFFIQILEKKLSFCCSLILKESSSSLSILACIPIWNVDIYLASKRKHTKAPVSLRFTALGENNFMRKTKKRSIKSESGTPAITEVFKVEFLSLSARVHPALLWQPLRNVAATLSAHCPADALEVSMATRMASRDCEGQSEPINGTMLRDKKRKEKKKKTR